MTPELAAIARRNLIFISGKGGVGKTIVSQALALALSQRGRRVLWTTFEDPTRPMGETVRISDTLWHLNCEAGRAFEEYIGMKIGIAPLARIFLQNKLMQYLAKAAPGIHELVLLGKVWHERLNYDHVVVDMPSTGYGVAMFQSTANFAKLFEGGPIMKDAELMLQTFRDPHLTGQLIVALPEEMPLVESLELQTYLTELFPKAPPAFLANRVFPGVEALLESEAPATSAGTSPDDWKSPVPQSDRDYVAKRALLERYNLRLWREKNIAFAVLPYLPPPAEKGRDTLVSRVAVLFREKGWV
jgi:hypothetical protein